MLILERKGKSDPRAAEWRSLRIVQGMFRFILKLAGVTYEVHGLENIPMDRAVLYVGNHRSYFDVLVGYVTVPGLTGFVAKKEMLRYPFLRDWMRLVNCVFLDRKNVKEALKAIMEAIGKLRGGISIWIFPEGTRNKVDPTDTKAFHYGTFKPAMKNSLEVSVFSLLGTQRVLNYKCKNKKNPVLIKFDRTFTHEDYKDLKTVDLSTKAYEICREGVQSLIDEDKKLVLEYNKKA